ncbi:MAG: LPS export ABC transporter periplasmic protein LptC [Pelomonas sp.]|nr:LPS export ABC transporter periplasmic protein LptC [Roseateles sp.]
MASGPLTPLAPPAGGPRRELPSWTWRVQALVSSWLPLFLMSLLAVGTAWLVKNTPLAGGPQTAAPLRHVPDYRMQHFELERIGADGLLRVRVEGEALRHYPDTDTVEIDGVSVRAISPNGGQILATAARAISNGDASQLQLIGDVHLRRFDPGQQPEQDVPRAVVRGDFVEALSDAQIMRSHLPVDVDFMGGTMHSDQGFVYDHLRGTVVLSGRSHAQFQPGSKR